MENTGAPLPANSSTVVQQPSPPPSSGIIPPQVPQGSNNNSPQVLIVLGIIIVLLVGMGSVWAMQRYFPSKKKVPTVPVTLQPTVSAPTVTPQATASAFVKPTKETLDHLAADILSKDADRVAAATGGNPNTPSETAQKYTQYKTLVLDIYTLEVTDETQSASVLAKGTLPDGSESISEVLLLWKNGRWIMW